MNSENYKQLLKTAYTDQDLSADDFENTLEHYAKLFHQEQSDSKKADENLSKLFETVKKSLPKIDGNDTTSWKFRREIDETITISCCNRTRDFLSAPDVTIPDGYELLRKRCLEDDERWTRWEWVIREMN